MTVTMSRIAVALPSRRDSVDEILTRHGRPHLERRLFTRAYGMRTSLSLRQGETLLDLLVRAGREALGGRPADLVLYGHTLLVQPFGPDGRLVARLRHGLGLPRARVHGISGIACTSVLRSLDLARRYLERPGAGTADTVLVLGGDQGSMGGASRIIPGFVVCGDGAAACAVRRAGGRYRYLGGAWARDTRFHRNLRMTDAEAREYGASCADGVARAFRGALTVAGLRLGDVDLVLPHLCNRFVWQAVCRELGIEIGRVHLDLLGDVGHIFGIDALLSLDHAERAGRLEPGQRCVLVAMGQGAYFQASVVEIVAET